MSASGSARGRSLLFVITSLDRGGADAQVADVACILSARGWRVAVASLLEPRAHLEKLRAAGVDVVSLQMRRGVPDPRGALRLLREIRRRRVDVLHGHMYHANILSRLVGRIARVPVVISTIHSIREGGRLREVVYRSTDRLADVTTAVSYAAGEYYAGIGAVNRARLRIVPNGVDLSVFQREPTRNRTSLRGELGLEQGAFLWIAVGRLDPDKDLGSLLRAMALLVRRVGLERRPKLAIVGGGPLRSELRSLATELALDDAVVFLGFRDDVPELLRTADAFVMSSEVEGLPMALLEASASGLPIVATDVGGNREIVVDGQTGVLVEPHDPAGLAAAMEQLMADSARAQMGARGRRQTAAEYGLPAAVDRWEALYGDLLHGGARPSRR